MTKGCLVLEGGAFRGLYSQGVMDGMNYVISRIINILITVVTLVIVVGYFREDGKWSPDRGKKAFRYYTTQSNVLCAVSTLCICLFPQAQWTYYLKVVGTAAVTVTMLTVLLFLGRIYGYGPLLKGSESFMHLINPLLAIVSLCVFERRGIGFAASFIGLLPVALYAPLYLYNVVFAPQEKRWDDFYAFNRDGRWWIAYVMMLAGTAVICLGLYVMLNV